jgi:ABC-type nitrate/sulfonate/bicarbonate transport system substrate-binding protein
MNQGAYRDFLAAANRWGERAGQAMVQLAKALYGGTRWSASYSGEEHTAEVVVDDAGEFPDSARYAAQGFVKVLFTRIEDAEVEVSSHSPKKDRIVYSIRRS